MIRTRTIRKYRAAIVGCGRIASFFADDKKRKGIVTHAQAYQSHPRTELVAACDLDQNRLDAFGKRWNIHGLYTDFGEMLRRENIDFLSVCTWSSSHAELVKKAAQNGVRGIICEKPIADTLHSADSMISTCRRNSVSLVMHYMRRYVPVFARVKKMLDSGEFGEIQSVSCYYTAGVVNTGTHIFDFLNYFFGDVAWVWADPKRVLKGDDPSFSGYLFYKKGFGCTISALDVKDYLIFESHIYGSKGVIKVLDSGTTIEIYKTSPHPLFSGYKGLKAARILKGDLGEGLPRLLNDLVHSVERKQDPVSSGVDGRASLEVAHALHVSANKLGRIVVLPLKTRGVVTKSK